MRDLFHNLSPVSSTSPQTVTSDTTTTGADVTRDESFSLMASMHVGGHSGGTFKLNVQHADDDGNGAADTWADVPDKHLTGTEDGTTLSKNGVAAIGYTGGKEHVRFNVVSSNGANATVGVLVHKGHLRHAPDSNQRVS